MGRVRAVLRLGERADAWTPRRGVLAAARGLCSRADPRARVRPGRVTLPLARAGVDLVGIDRSAAMLERLTRQCSTSRMRQLRVLRGDIRALPFRDGAFNAVLAPYGVLQSLTSPRDLKAALASVARVLPGGGIFGVDLVPDVATWREYTNKRRFQGRVNG